MKSISRILLSGVFFLSVMIAADAMAQASQPNHPANQQAQNAAAQKAAQAIESNPSCSRILSECKKLGFVVGQWKKDNGLWKDCFDPVVKGGTQPTRDGKPINVPVSQSDVQACRTVAEAQQHKAQ
jgi:hypothetical protein